MIEEYYNPCNIEKHQGGKKMDFKAFREEKMKMTQEDFAKLIGVDKGKVLEWEKDPDKIKLSDLQNISECTGLDLNTIVCYKKTTPNPFRVNNMWGETEKINKDIVEYIRQNLEHMNIPKEEKEKYVNGLLEGIEKKLIKPNISLVGRSDTGKSTLINALIGMDKMPTSWTPTTSIAVYIKHVNDKPDFIKEDVWVFASSVDGEKIWNVEKLKDEEYCKKWRIAQGDIGILRSFGTRQGDMYSKEAGSAVVFIDAPILLNCDIVDLPGFGTGLESDDVITNKTLERTDILIYLSQANGFMRFEDILYLKEHIRTLPIWEMKGENNLKPLSNLFIVASQAHTVNYGNPKELTNILRKGYENFGKALGPGYWSRRKKLSGYVMDNYEEEVFAKRFFTYTTDIPSLRTRFNEELKYIVEALPQVIDARTKEFIRTYIRTRIPNIREEIRYYEGMLADRDKYEKRINDLDKEELVREKENYEEKENIRKKIDQFLQESIDEFSQYYTEILTTDSLVKMLKESKVKNKQDDIECFTSRFQETILGKCNYILSCKANALSKELGKYLEKYNEKINCIFDDKNVHVDFDAGYEFVSALSKIGIIGGLGAFLVGIVGNIPLLGTVAASHMAGTAVLAALNTGGIMLGMSVLGPVGIALGLSIAAVQLFSGGWEKNVAKRIVKVYEENNIGEKIRKEINNYWKKTENAFDEAAEKLDEKWNDYVNGLRNTLDNFDKDEIQKKIDTLNVLLKFLETVPM